MSRRTITIGDKVRFKTERPPRIATVIEILEGGADLFDRRQIIGACLSRTNS